MTKEVKFVIRTSDRAAFRKCRRQWDFGSRIRQGYESTSGSPALEFGTSFHSALEVYYDPQNWRTDHRDQRPVEGVRELAILRFIKANAAFRKLNPFNEELETKQDYDERLELGRAMLNYYFDWAPDHDKFWPLHTEIDFEVPILNPQDGAHLYANRQPLGGNEFATMLYDIHPDDLESFLNDMRTNDTHPVNGTIGATLGPVVYQGRIDLIIQDYDGNVWLWDHKTAQRRDENMTWLDLDSQITSYCWAAEQLMGLRLQGFVYQQHFKQAPSAPAILKKPAGALSTAKDQDTTAKLYEQAILERTLAFQVDTELLVDGEPVAIGREERVRISASDKEYEFLQWLRQNEKDYIRRFNQPRTPQELAQQGRYIYDEAHDMLADPSIYPSPSKFNCQYCAFNLPCLTANEGNDPSIVLDSDRYRLIKNAPKIDDLIKAG